MNHHSQSIYQRLLFVQQNNKFFSTFAAALHQHEKKEVTKMYTQKSHTLNWIFAESILFWPLVRTSISCVCDNYGFALSLMNGQNLCAAHNFCFPKRDHTNKFIVSNFVSALFRGDFVYIFIHVLKTMVIAKILLGSMDFIFAHGSPINIWYMVCINCIAQYGNVSAERQTHKERKYTIS